MKPSSFDIQFAYKCPKCGLQYWLNKAEAKTTNFKIVCCNSSFTIDHIKDIKVHLKFGRNSDAIAKEAYLNLKSMGYSLKKIQNFQEIVNADSSEELVAKFLKVQ